MEVHRRSCKLPRWWHFSIRYLGEKVEDLKKGSTFSCVIFSKTMAKQEWNIKFEFLRVPVLKTQQVYANRHSLVWRKNSRKLILSWILLSLQAMLLKYPLRTVVERLFLKLLLNIQLSDKCFSFILKKFT